MRTVQLKKKKIGVVGASGKMGLEIIKLLQNHPHFEAYFAITREKNLKGYQHHSSQWSHSNCKNVDIWVDFSSPRLLEGLLNFATKHGQPVVSGVTGLKASDHKKISQAAKHIPVLWSSNMSLGVAVLKEALRSFALLQDFDFQIEEAHHRHKKDRPSGTALTLQETLQKIVQVKVPPPLSIRGGGIFGIHKVWAMSPEETLTFEHTALQRSVFAKGALMAAQWLLERRPGLYQMSDLFFQAE